MADVTQILRAIEQGDPQAAAELLPLVYDELRKLAAQTLAREKPGQTLQATALVHEAYLRLAACGDGTPRKQTWTSRGHFFAAAAQAMRRILVDQARRKLADKRGAGSQRIPLDAADVGYDSSSDDLLDVDEALTRLAVEDPQAARLIQLRYFAGLSIEDAAEAVGIRARRPTSTGRTRASACGLFWTKSDWRRHRMILHFRRTNQTANPHCR